LEIVASGSVEPGALGVGAGKPGGGRPLPPRRSGGITPGKFLEIYITVRDGKNHDFFKKIEKFILPIDVYS